MYSSAYSTNLDAFTILRNLLRHSQDSVDVHGTPNVVTFHPLVSSTSLTEHEVDQPERLCEKSRTNAVRGSHYVATNRSQHVVVQLSGGVPPQTLTTLRRNIVYVNINVVQVVVTWGT